MSAQQHNFTQEEHGHEHDASASHSDEEGPSVLAGAKSSIWAVKPGLCL